MKFLARIKLFIIQHIDLVLTIVIILIAGTILFSNFRFNATFKKQVEGLRGELATVQSEASLVNKRQTNDIMPTLETLVQESEVDEEWKKALLEFNKNNKAISVPEVVGPPDSEPDVKRRYKPKKPAVIVVPQAGATPSPVVIERKVPGPVRYRRPTTVWDKLFKPTSTPTPRPKPKSRSKQ